MHPSSQPTMKLSLSEKSMKQLILFFFTLNYVEGEDTFQSHTQTFPYLSIARTDLSLKNPCPIAVSFNPYSIFNNSTLPPTCSVILPLSSTYPRSHNFKELSGNSEEESTICSLAFKSPLIAPPCAFIINYPTSLTLSLMLISIS